MKSVWFILLLASLFSKSYCSIERTATNQPSSLPKSDLTSMAKWQMNHSLTNEPFVAYNKLENGTLELFGTAFGNEVTEEKIEFLQKHTSNLRIHSVIFKWFYFDEKMLRIFDGFDEKVQNSVKSVTFEKCYFPKTFLFKSSLELHHVTDCSFIDCFANEESLKEMFKIFKNTPITSLTITKVFDYMQHEFIRTNVSLKSIATQNAIQRLMKINKLKLDSFFPNIKFFSLTDCYLDFNHFSLTSLLNLNYVDLNVRFENFCIAKIFKCLPMSVKHIKTSHSSDYYNLNFIESAFDKKVIIDLPYPFNYDEINRVKALSVFSSLRFDMHKMNDKMAIIKEYVERNGGAVNTVTSVKFIMVFNHQNITNMITLLTYFPNLDNVCVHFMNNCDAFLTDNEINQLFSALPAKSVKKLTIVLRQNKETSTFYRFIVELMKLCQNMTSLEFIYFSSNSFAINIKEMVERENIQFTNLTTFIVDYSSKHIDVSIDFFYVAKYNIKNLTMEMNNSIQNLYGLDKYECFSVVDLSFAISHIRNFENVINKLFAKFPNVRNFDWSTYSEELFPIGVIQNMKRLKNVMLKDTLSRKYFPNLLSLLPPDVESLQIKCISSVIKKIERIFMKDFLVLHYQLLLLRLIRKPLFKISH